jgi:hypothetical protein
MIANISQKIGINADCHQTPLPYRDEIIMKDVEAELPSKSSGTTRK